MSPLSSLPARLAVSISFLTLAACSSSTKLVESWVEPEFTGNPFQKILVMAVVKDDLKRRSAEEKLAGHITGGGIEGIAGYSIISDLSDYDNKAKIKQAVHQVGADAVLITTLVKVNKEERYVPPRVDYVPDYGRRYGMYDYWGARTQAIYSPGYTTVDTVVKLETSVFSVASEKVVWSGRTESFNPKSSEKVVQENAQIIIGDLKKAGLI